MANGYDPGAQTLGKRKHMETEEEDIREDTEIEKLKSELNEMARRIVDHRKTMPDLLTKVLSSNLAFRRPIDSPRLEVMASAEFSATEEGLLPEVDDRIKEKLRIFREKSERNVAAMPDKLKRLKECIHKIDEIGQFNDLESRVEGLGYHSKNC